MGLIADLGQHFQEAIFAGGERACGCDHVGNLRIAKVAHAGATVCGNTVAPARCPGETKKPGERPDHIRSVSGLGVRRRRLGELPFGSWKYATLSGWI